MFRYTVKAQSLKTARTRTVCSKIEAIQMHYSNNVKDTVLKESNNCKFKLIKIYKYSIKTLNL